MEEILTLINKLAGASFATLLALILWGSWRGVWVWGRQLREQEAKSAAENSRISDERDFYRDSLWKALGINEEQVKILKVKERKVDELNRRLLE